MAFGTAHLSMSACSAAHQPCDLGKSLNLSGVSYLSCQMELIIAPDRSVVVRSHCVKT